MKIFKCIICHGQIEFLNQDFIEKKVRCCKCGFTNDFVKEPEVFVIKKKLNGQY